MKAPKKLIEVALPLKAINEACAREKSIRHGHPSTLHLWWARRPLAAARAVIFSQMVNDPLEKYGENPTPQQRSAATKERNRLFKIIEELVKWENTNNEEVLKKAREKIWESWRETCKMNEGEPSFDPEKLPAFHDPFAGGGALPLEAQRLGLESYASDLNPVAVMINKAMIEIPPKFAGRKPIGPIPDGVDYLAAKDAKSAKDGFWPGATGLAEDVRRYGYWMREEAKKRIGHLYPQVEITAEMANSRPDLKPYVGQKLTVIAWLWARTVKSPNPMFSHVDVPLVSSFILSSKKGKEAYVEPIVEGDKWHFEVRVGTPPNGAEGGTKLGRGAKFKCLVSNAPMEMEYIQGECAAGRLSSCLMAIVAEGKNGRVYLSPLNDQEAIAKSVKPLWRPTTPFAHDPRHFSPPLYGLKTYGDIFTDRQLVALNTFSDLVQEARGKVIDDCGDEEYANAIAVYLTFVLDKAANYWTSICTWHVKAEKLKSTFGRQAVQMTWDYTECNPLGDSSGNWCGHLDFTEKSIAAFPSLNTVGFASQADAQTQKISCGKLISTDPPYYDNIGYADLSDFFYAWMRRSLRNSYAELFSTMAVPKSEELVATPYRHGGKEAAEEFFMNGMTIAMHNLCKQSHESFPVTIYYAFKQSETNTAGTTNAGWETFLDAVIASGFKITGTWPMRTELVTGLKTSINVLASSIVLVCRRRSDDASEITRRDFLRELKAKMPDALEDMMGGTGEEVPVAPVDMSQSAIGPGMEIFSKYKAVLNADGSRMSVHDAIVEVNKFLDQSDDSDDGCSEDFDAETRFCRDWFRQYKWSEGPSGEADVLARAKGVSVPGVVDAGVLKSVGGKTALVHWQDYPEDYDPRKDEHRPVWEVCHHLVRIHQRHGTGAAGDFLALVPEQGEAARQLAYLLYTICERKGLADDARVYNELATAWSDILAYSIANAKPVVRQGELGI